MRKRGLTLVEVLVAIFVLTIGIAGLIASFNAASKQVRSSNNIFLASRLGQSKIEELRNMAYADLDPLGLGETDSDTDIIGGYTVTRTWTITTINLSAVNAFKGIDVQVAWNEKGRPFQRRLVTRRSAE